MQADRLAELALKLAPGVLRHKHLKLERLDAQRERLLGKAPQDAPDVRDHG